MQTPLSLKPPVAITVPAVAWPFRDELIDVFATQERISRSRSTRVIDALFHFLAVAATFRGRNLRPADEISAAWMLFVAYTKEYTEFCDELGGYIHFRPATSPRTIATTTPADAINLMEKFEIPFNKMVWMPECVSPETVKS
ncbi:MAG: hypothetical protein WCV86_04895 [Patescibacteria group bacterium]|jgi:hypothetical protein